MKIIQIVPRISLGFDGIGDYSLILAERLRRLHCLETEFLTCDPTTSGSNVVEGFPVHRLIAQTVDDLVKQLSLYSTADSGGPSPILIQFAPYGYSQKGCPTWLIEGLSQWKRKRKGKLVTMFHELDARGNPPSKSAFWLNPIQRLLIKKLAALSDQRLTNCVHYAEILSGWGFPDASLTPTFSNIGEPAENHPMSARSRQLVVFGRPWQRQLNYTEGRDSLILACNRIEAKRIIDIGQPIPTFDSHSVEGVPIETQGQLSALDVGRLLSTSIASFIRYPVSLLSKSGVFAACCAYGTIPFIDSMPTKGNPLGDLIDGRDFSLSSFSHFQPPERDFQILSSSIFERYQLRNSVRAADLFAGLLR
jgi:hypothetical protein